MFDKYLEEFIKRECVKTGYDQEINLWFAWTSEESPVGLTGSGETEQAALEHLASLYIVYKSLNNIVDQ